MVGVGRGILDLDLDLDLILDEGCTVPLFCCWCGLMDARMPYDLWRPCAGAWVDA